MASLLLEQQEKLRRHVDEWRFRCRAAVAEIGPRSASTSVSSAPVRLRVAPTDPGVGVGAASLLTTAAAAEDNVDVSKFVAVLSHSCLEISRLSDAASSNLYRQLLLFGHTAEGPNEALLEGEPQKTFAHSIPLLLEVYEIINGLVMILGNLLRQLDAICSVRDKNVRPLNSFKGLDLTTVFGSLGEGLMVFLLVDEILRHNGNTRSYLSLFSRMLDKVKSEVDVFSMSFEDVDFLDQVVHNLQKLFDIGFFQRLVQEDSPLCSSITLVRSNKKLLDTFYSFFSESSSEIIQRIGSLKELPIDRRTILHLLGLFLFFTTTTGEAPDKKSMNLLVEIFQLVPVVYVEGGKRIVLSDLIRFHCSPSLSLLPPIKEACEAFGIMKNSYLARLNEMHSRDIQAINDSLSCWSVSFQSAIHPSSQMLTEEWVRHLQKQILQGVVLADRIHMLVLSMLDLHMHLEVPLRREKAKSLCQMIVSLKAIGDLFHMKGSSLVRSLPHIINIIQSDIEQLIISLKTKLQNEIAKGSQAVKTGFLSSLIRGGTDTETRLIDSLSLVLMSLQLLEGGGSSQRQLTLSITMDILHSLGYLDIELVGVRKLISKFSILSNFWSLIDERTNCSFLYWRKEMLVTWLSMVYGDACKLSWLQNIIDAFFDGMSLLTLGNVGTVTLQHYEEEIENALRKEVVAPLCRDIETDLRLHVHSTHLKGSVFVNPTKTGVRNLSWYLRMKPLRLPSKFVDIKLLVENHLNSAFYTYSVMSNYDNRMYAEMHQLGELKYGVELEDFHLTVDTADQDFDLKQSMENLDSFSEAYSYNIVKQMFIENDLGGQGRKNLRVLCVDHIASSAATCNLQRISAYIDSIFVFLNRMFVDLHALLQSNIEIDLLRDFKQSEVQAAATRIGSVLGLMMVLTAGRTRYLNNMSRYVRKPKFDLRYTTSCKLLGWDDDIVEIGKVLDMGTRNNDPSDDRIQPFSILATNFSKKLQSNKLHEMKDFFQIVPSVIAHMMECRLLLKDKLLRRGHEDKRYTHTYDGFLLGVAFVLKVLEQDNSFDELNWFASTKAKLEGEAKDRDDKKTDRNTSGASFVSLKLWRSSPPVRTEQQKGGVDKGTRYMQEIELIECLFRLARTVLR
uniref:WASH complex subunit 4 N-terminal domain-containing protein n=1 Tax=Oryza glumipatula TaxID=40148 RepID=A0A0E0A4P5_9ORYZ